MILNRSCAGCSRDIGDKHKNAKYCTTKCKDAVRFWGTFCAWCNHELIIARANRHKTKYCSSECQRRGKHQDWLERNPQFKEDYFAEPNLENSYWAGFIAADGCIATPHVGQRRLQIKLASADQAHLKTLRNTIGVGNIHERERYLKETEKFYPQVEYTVTSNKICDDLAENFNIYPRKSQTLKPPNLEDDLAYAFIAGYIDGDGSYFKVHSRLRISVLGTYSFLNWIANIYEVGRVSKKDNRDNVYRITFYGKDSIRMVESYRYLNLPLLERKKNRWEDIGLITEIEDEVNTDE